MAYISESKSVSKKYNTMRSIDLKRDKFNPSSAIISY